MATHHYGRRGGWMDRLKWGTTFNELGLIALTYYSYILSQISASQGNLCFVFVFFEVKTRLVLNYAAPSTTG
jgi:hypothetical protein